MAVVAIVLVATLSVAVIAAETETVVPGTVSEATALLTTAKTTAADATKSYHDKLDAFFAVTEYMTNHPIDPTSDGYEKLVSDFNAAKLAFAKTVLEEANAISYTDSAADGEAAGVPAARKNSLVNTLKTFVERNPISSSTEGYEAFKAEYNAAVLEKETYVADSKAEIDDSVSLTDYDLPSYIVSDYDDNLKGMSIGGGGNTPQYTSELAQDPDTKNRYWSITYYGTTSAYTAYYPHDVADSVIFQFDICINDMPNAGILFEQGGGLATYMRIEADGTVRDGYKRGSLDANLIEGVRVVEGQWTNIAIAVNLEVTPYIYDIYVDYQKVAEGCEVYPTTEYTPSCLRFGGGGNTSGNYYLDNVFFYKGTTLRTLGRIDAMNAEEKFFYYANYAVDEEKTPATRKTAYNSAYELYNKGLVDVNSAAVKESIARLDEIDTNILNADVLNYNVAGIAALLDAYDKIERSPLTESARATAITKVDTFIQGCGTDLPLDREDYKALTVRLSKARDELAEDERIRLFNAQMLRFASAYTIAAKQTHYSEAKALFEEGISDKILTMAGYKEYQENYKIYLAAADELATAIKEANSKKVVDCVGFISKYTTEEEWVANYDKMERYVLIIRETLNSGEYNINYPGFVNAVNIFTPMDEFFYARLQEGHIQFITEQLALYEVAERYVDKVGVIAGIKRYLAEADIDPNNETIAELIVRLDYYDAEVQVRGEDYAAVLAENSAKFILIIDRLELQTTYLDKREVFEEAATYYYSIDRDYEGIAEAIAIYREYEAEFDLMDVSSEAFIECVALIKTANKAEDIYARLVDCYYHYPYINTEIEGVAEALAEYEEAYNSYNEVYISANAEIECTAQAAVTVRTNCGVDAIIAIIYKVLFG